MKDLKPVPCLNNGKKAWRVDCKEDGKRRRRFFKSKVKASAFCRDFESRAFVVGVQKGIVAADPKFIEDASAAAAILRGTGISLLGAAEIAKARFIALGGSRSLSATIESFLRAKRDDGRSKRHLDDLEGRLRRFDSDHPEALIRALDVAALDAWLLQLDVGTQSRVHYRRALHTLFQWALKRGWVEVNPAAAVEIPIVRRDPPEIFTPDQFKEMLEAAAGDGRMVAWLGLAGWGGLRPSEICRLDWECVHDNEIEVTGKGHRRRLVDIQPCLQTLLSAVRLPSGPIVPRSWETCKQLRNFKKSFEFKWPHDGLRHSYGTYHLRHFEDAGKTALQMGHGGNPAMLFRHYNRPGISRAVAAAWWQL